MYDYQHTFTDRMRWLCVVMLALFVGVLASLLVMPSEATTMRSTSTTSTAEDEYVMNKYDSPNVVANGMATAADTLDAALTTTEERLNRTGQSVVTAGTKSGSLVVGGVQASGAFVGGCFRNTGAFIGAGVGNTVSFIGSGFAHSATFITSITSGTIGLIASVPSSIVGFAADAPIVSAITQPADNASAPLIGPVTPLTAASQAVLPVAAAASQPKAPAKTIDTGAAWPIHGEITTLFGVPHWPYQPTHSGIDISDGQPAGVTPIKPFRPGRVVEAVRSYSGLGNHVIVDHGDGLTSVYGHLSSISVEAGQLVDKNTTLGFEGSTGASTGTHLHFEIRLNGQAIDPRQYINGLP